MTYYYKLYWKDPGPDEDWIPTNEKTNWFAVLKGPPKSKLRIERTDYEVINCDDPKEIGTYYKYTRSSKDLPYMHRILKDDVFLELI